MEIPVKVALLAFAILYTPLAAHAQAMSSGAGYDAAALAQNMSAARSARYQSTQTRSSLERLNRRSDAYNPVRENRAERVAALLNAGDCAGAYQITIDERDRDMASRVIESCGPQIRPAAQP